MRALRPAGVSPGAWLPLPCTHAPHASSARAPARVPLWPGPNVGDFAQQISDQLARRKLGSWLLATDCTDAAELATLHAVPSRVDAAALLDGEDGVGTAVMDMVCTHELEPLDRLICQAPFAPPARPLWPMLPAPPARPLWPMLPAPHARPLWPMLPAPHARPLWLMCLAHKSSARGLACAQWLCAGADFFLGTRGSM